MNKANKITISRIILSLIIITILLFPFDEVGLEFPTYILNGNIVIDLKYIIVGILFIIASLTDFFDGYIARKYTIVTVIIVMRDIIVDSIKMVVGNKGAAVAAIKIAKVKTATLMTGIVLTLFYNLPFELIPLRVSDFLLALAAVLSIISGIKYYMMAKPYLQDK